MAIFQDNLGKPVPETRMSSFWILLELRMMEVAVTARNIRGAVKFSPPQTNT